MFPELEEELKSIVIDIYTTGEPFISNEIQGQLKRTGKTDRAYFNSVYQPLRDLDTQIYGITFTGTEVTVVVKARKPIEASELFNRSVLESSLDCLKVLDTKIRIRYMNFNGLCKMEIANSSIIKNKNWYAFNPSCYYNLNSNIKCF